MGTTIPVPPAADKAWQRPVTEEVEGRTLPVRGAIPPELAGRYFRNGGNPRSGALQHPFLGDGMVHGVRLEGGAARWYRNRWVRTRSFEGRATSRRPDGTLDLTVGVANTHVIAHARRILALVESSFPYELSPELDTLGPHDFGGRLATPFTAHPKRCPRTGELHAFGMNLAHGALTYHRVDRAGALVESRPVAVSGATMMHDFALTDRHVVFFDLPVVFDPARLGKGDMPYVWSERYPARIGVLRRDDPQAEVRWSALAPCYVFHVLNAYDDGADVVVDAVRYPELWRRDSGDFPPTTLHRFRVRADGAVDEATLDPVSVEFPRCDERRTGTAYRYGYAVERRDDGRGVLRKYDLARATAARCDFGAGRPAGEPVFVPARDGAAEDEGWLLVYVYDTARDASELAVVDAASLEQVAAVELPQRVPAGYHGSWIDDREL